MAIFDSGMKNLTFDYVTILISDIPEVWKIKNKMAKCKHTCYGKSQEKDRDH